MLQQRFIRFFLWFFPSKYANAWPMTSLSSLKRRSRSADTTGGRRRPVLVAAREAAIRTRTSRRKRRRGRRRSKKNEEKTNRMDRRYDRETGELCIFNAEARHGLEDRRHHHQRAYCRRHPHGTHSRRFVALTWTPARRRRVTRKREKNKTKRVSVTGWLALGAGQRPPLSMV